MKANFTKIPNRLLESIAMSRCFGERTRVLCVVLRKTYGWGKEADHIALSQFVKLTGMRKPNVCRALRRLRAQGVLANEGGRYRICPDFAQKAHSFSPSVISLDNGGGISLDNECYQNSQRGLSDRRPTKETNTKEKNKKTGGISNISFVLPASLKNRLKEIAERKSFPPLDALDLLIARAESGDMRARRNLNGQ